ncbi:MAG: phasin family protein [Rubrimonas sp.]|uniref:phasin family protein n=1 Tax=Rubrimonas sp. TaxID=2036015 RepID=UPI002FDD45D9
MTAKTAPKTVDAAAAIETFAADAQKSLTENMEKATKSFEDVAAFGQETLDAMIKSQSIAAKAAEEINAEVIAFSKKTLEETVAHAKELAASQTVTDFIEKQSGFAKTSFDAMVKQSTKMNELVLAAMKDAMAPVAARVTAAVDMMKANAA